MTQARGQLWGRLFRPGGWHLDRSGIGYQPLVSQRGATQSMISTLWPDAVLNGLSAAAVEVGSTVRSRTPIDGWMEWPEMVVKGAARVATAIGLLVCITCGYKEIKEGRKQGRTGGGGGIYRAFVDTSETSVGASSFTLRSSAKFLRTLLGTSLILKAGRRAPPHVEREDQRRLEVSTVQKNRCSSRFFPRGRIGTRLSAVNGDGPWYMICPEEWLTAQNPTAFP